MKKITLFDGISEKEIQLMLKCLSAVVRSYGKGEYIFRRGDHISSVAVLLEGRVHIQKEDFWGNLSILSEIAEGDVFGEVYACFENEEMVNYAAAVKDSRVLFLNLGRVLETCSSACPFHGKLIRNLLFVMASKNRMLTQKLEHMSRRTTREKLLSYLSEQSQRAGSSSFHIPFNRQQLADYLSVDRSAMSSELCRMRDEGILEFQKNHFVLK